MMQTGVIKVKLEWSGGFLRHHISFMDIWEVTHQECWLTVGEGLLPQMSRVQLHQNVYVNFLR